MCMPLCGGKGKITSYVEIYDPFSSINPCDTGTDHKSDLRSPAVTPVLLLDYAQRHISHRATLNSAKPLHELYRRGWLAVREVP